MKNIIQFIILLCAAGNPAAQHPSGKLQGRWRGSSGNNEKESPSAYLHKEKVE
jgi:hypothetical protein